MVDTNIGIQNLFVVNSQGITQGYGQAVIDIFDPTGGLPVNPSNGDVYISAATANGWVASNLEYYDTEHGWKNMAPVSGSIVYVTAIGEPRVYNPLTGTWVSLPDFMGTIAGPGASTNNALVRWNGIDGSTLANSPIIVDDLGNMSGINDITINGKATILGTIDPTGLELTPVATNPGGPNMIWINSTTGDRITIGAAPIPTIAGAMADNAIVRFDGATGTIQSSTATLSDAGDLALGSVTAGTVTGATLQSGNLTITGDNITSTGDITINGVSMNIGGELEVTGVEIAPNSISVPNGTISGETLGFGASNEANALFATVDTDPSPPEITLYDNTPTFLPWVVAGGGGAANFNTTNGTYTPAAPGCYYFQFVAQLYPPGAEFAASIDAVVLSAGLRVGGVDMFIKWGAPSPYLCLTTSALLSITDDTTTVAPFVSADDISRLNNYAVEGTFIVIRLTS